MRSGPARLCLWRAARDRILRDVHRPTLLALLTSAACAALFAPEVARAAPGDAPKPRAAPPVVAVLPLRALGVPPDAAAALEKTLRNEVGQLPEVTVAPAEVLAAALQREPDCVARVACSAAAAAKAGAQRFVAGTVSELGDAYMVDLKLVDARSGQELKRVTHPISGRQELLIELLRATAVELLAPARFVGRLSVKLQGALPPSPAIPSAPTSSPGAAPGAPASAPASSGVLLFIDGKPAGSLPLPAPLEGLTPGQHTLRVSKEGFRDATLFVEIRFDRTTEAWVDLESGSLAGVVFLRTQEQAHLTLGPPAPAAALGVSEPAAQRGPWLKIAGWSGVGLGVVSVVIGVALHAKAYATASELNRKVATNTLAASDASLYDDLDREVLAARILYALGAAVGGGGGALLLWERYQEQKAAGPLAQAALRAGPIILEGGGGLLLAASF